MCRVHVNRVGLQQRGAVAAQLGQVIDGVNKFLEPDTSNEGRNTRVVGFGFWQLSARRRDGLNRRLFRESARILRRRICSGCRSMRRAIRFCMLGEKVSPMPDLVAWLGFGESGSGKEGNLF